jgi:hypothetical protein
MATAILLDSTNLFFCINKAFESRRLNYAKVLEHVTKEIDAEIIRKNIYGMLTSPSISNFIAAVEFIGYSTTFKKPPRNMEKASNTPAICVDAMVMVDRMSDIVLGTTDPSIVPLIEHLKSRGIVTRVFGCGIPMEVKKVADSSHEIWEELLDPTE